MVRKETVMDSLTISTTLVERDSGRRGRCDSLVHTREPGRRSLEIYVVLTEIDVVTPALLWSLVSSRF